MYPDACILLKADIRRENLQRYFPFPFPAAIPVIPVNVYAGRVAEEAIFPWLLPKIRQVSIFLLPRENKIGCRADRADGRSVFAGNRLYYKCLCNFPPGGIQLSDVGIIDR
jgi:hypothetical protein